MRWGRFAVPCECIYRISDPVVRLLGTSSDFVSREKSVFQHKAVKSSNSMIEPIISRQCILYQSSLEGFTCNFLSEPDSLKLLNINLNQIYDSLVEAFLNNS